MERCSPAQRSGYELRRQTWRAYEKTFWEKEGEGGGDVKGRSEGLRVAKNQSCLIAFNLRLISHLGKYSSVDF